MRGVVLLDLDGTLWFPNGWGPGALETVRWLMEHRWAVRVLSNKTLRSRVQIYDRFRQAGLDFPRAWIFTPVRAAVQWLQTQPLIYGVMALVHPDLRADLAPLPLREAPPVDFVLVGDMGDAWNVQALNAALRALLGEARLLALHMNPRWHAWDGERVDAGAFVRALEYASGRTCERVFGKPNPLFFQMAVASVETTGPVWMVGDSVENDIQPAKRLGFRTVLVGRPEAEECEWVDHRIASVAELPSILAQEGGA